MTDAARGLREYDDQHDERDGIEEQRNFGDVLNTFRADPGQDAAPENAGDDEGRAHRFGGDANAFEDEVRGEEGCDGVPADLKSAHEQAGHDVSAGGSEGGTSDDVERVAGLHSHHGRDAVVERVAEQARKDEGREAIENARVGQRSASHLLVEGNPKKDTRIARCGIDVPRSAVPGRVGRRFR